MPGMRTLSATRRTTAAASLLLRVRGPSHRCQFQPGAVSGSANTVGVGTERPRRRGQIVPVQVAGVALLTLSTERTLAAPGDLDPSFGNGGIADTGLNQDVSLFDLAAQAEGKILAVGSELDRTFAVQFLVAARYTSTGSPDPSFAGDGVFRLDEQVSEAEAVTVQPDGKIVIAGFVVDGLLRPLVVRLNPDGSLDSTFDGDGKLVWNSCAGSGIGVDLQQNGKIVASGKNVLGRFNPDGSPDLGFGNNGQASLPFNFLRLAQMLEPSGRIVLVGNGASGPVLVAYQGDPVPTASPTPTFTPTVTPSPTSLCGNGIVETDEDCDDGNTVSGECCDSSCHFEPVTQSCDEFGQVCTVGHCDGSGRCKREALLESECPQGYVLLEAPASATVEAVVGQSSLASGSSCTTRFETRRGGVLSGNAIGDASSGTGIRLRQSSSVQQECITAGASVAVSGNPPGGCSMPPDITGGSEKLASCAQAANRAEQRRLLLLALPAGQAFGHVTVSSDQTLNVATLGAVAVVEYNSLTIGRNKTLTIQGDAGTEAVLVRVANDFRVRGWGKVSTQGIPAGPKGHPAERVLFLVGGEADIGRNGKFDGSIFAQNGVQLGMDAQARGALLAGSGTLRTGRTSHLTHAPWVLW